MAAIASTLNPTVTVKVYKNGNRNFLGKTLVINRRHIRTMEALYDEVTAHIAAFNAVRRICTPIGGRPVLSLENIKNKSVYVAAGREGFKKLNYADLGITKPRPQRKTNNSPKKAVIVAEGRHKMDYEWAKRDLKIIHVFCNGDVFRPSVKIVLQKRLQQSMEQILGIVQEHVFLAAAIAALYTIDGKLVLSPAQLISGQNYVAVERGRMFKRANYGAASSLLSKSPRGPFFPLIGNGQLTNTDGRLPKKNITKRKPRVTKATLQNKSTDHSPRDQSLVNSTLVESPRDVISNLSPDPPVVALQLRASQSNFTISASPPAQLEADTPVQEYPALPAGENDNDDSSVVSNVFKASGLQQEKADEIKDTRQTKEEKSIDLLPAEEVVEEVLEQVEDAKTSVDEVHEVSRDEAREEVEDDVEVVEDNSKMNQAADEVKQSQVQAWQHDESDSRAAINSPTGTKQPRRSPKEESGDPSTSSIKDETEKSAVDDIPNQEEKKDGETLSRQKIASPTDKEENQNMPPTAEPEKSENEEVSDDTEENQDDEEQKRAANDESDNHPIGSDSNTPKKNSQSEKGANDADKN